MKTSLFSETTLATRINTFDEDTQDLSYKPEGWLRDHVAMRAKEEKLYEHIKILLLLSRVWTPLFLSWSLFRREDC
jgi:hypothetical protein